MTTADQTTSLLSAVPEENSPSKNSMNYVRDHVVLCVIFTVIYTAFGALQNLETSLNQESNVGIVSLVCIYSTCILVSVVSPAFVAYFGGKRTLLIGWIGNCVFTAANFYPTLWTIVPASIILGSVSAQVWTTQGIYVSRYALGYAEVTGKDSSLTLSKFNGVFFMLYQSTQITGNLISSLVLYRDTDDVTETLYSNHSRSLCGPNDCPGSIIVNGTSNVQDETMYILLGIFLGLDMLAFVLTIFLVRPLDSEKADTNALRSVSHFLNRFMDIDIILVCPLFLLNGFEQATIIGDVTKSFVTCTIGVREVGFVMVTYGVCNSLSSVVAGPLTRCIPRIFQLLFVTLVHTGLVTFLSLWNPAKYTFVILCSVAGIWGLCDAVWQTQTNAHIGYRFSGSLDSSFAILNALRSAGFALSFALSQLICTSVKLYILIGLICCSFLLYAISEVRTNTRKDDKLVENMESDLTNTSRQKCR